MFGGARLSPSDGDATHWPRQQHQRMGPAIGGSALGIVQAS
jgi:hypothetical protein